MNTVASVVQFLERIAPLQLAESWDNVGLLWGDRQQPVQKVMTCLTLTPDVAAEAFEKEVDLIVAHHPILFRGAKKITTDSSEGTMLLALAKHEIAVFSAHTAYDNCEGGLNDQIARLLGLKDVLPLKENTQGPQLSGSGRMGTFPQPCSLREILKQLEQAWKISAIPYVGNLDHNVEKIGIVCGSGGEYLTDAIRQGCQVFLTGETNFHNSLLARNSNIGLILPGHYASERHGMEFLAHLIRQAFSAIDCWASEVETDPLENGPLD
jgi:dinuclear metal center YbgI/SA1388 family protein